VGVQSEHADPVYRYYLERMKTTGLRTRDRQAQRGPAAMIGNPVSMPRVIELAREYTGSPAKAGLRGPGKRTGDHGCHDHFKPEWEYRVHSGRRIHGRLKRAIEKGMSARAMSAYSIPQLIC